MQTRCAIRSLSPSLSHSPIPLSLPYPSLSPIPLSLPYPSLSPLSLSHSPIPLSPLSLSLSPIPLSLPYPSLTPLSLFSLSLSHLIRCIAPRPGIRGIDCRLVLCPHSILRWNSYSILLNSHSGHHSRLCPNSNLIRLLHHLRRRLCPQSRLYLCPHSMLHRHPHSPVLRLDRGLVDWLPRLDLSPILLEVCPYFMLRLLDMVNDVCFLCRHSMLHGMGMGLSHGRLYCV